MLNKDPHQFVVRVLPEKLNKMGWNETEQVSSASTRINVSNADLESAMSTCRSIAPTHHAYKFSESEEAFLITDRVFVRFKKSAAFEVINDFITKYNLILKASYSSTEYLFQLTDYTGMNPVKLVVLLTEKEKSIKSAGHDLNRHITKICYPNSKRSRIH